MYDHNVLLKLHKYYNEKEGREFNQKEFAQKLGINASKLSLLESGRKEPSLNEARAYRKLTGASLDYIYGLTNVMNENTGGEIEKEIKALMNLAGDDAQRLEKSMNHLFGTYDCVSFFILLDALWKAESEYKVDTDMNTELAGHIADCLDKAETRRDRFSIQCRIEHMLFDYILSHSYNPL